MARYDAQRHQGLASLYGQEDPMVVCLISDALALWLQGYPDQATAGMQKALAFAHEFENSHTSAEAMVYASLLYQFCRDAPATQRQAETHRALGQLDAARTCVSEAQTHVAQHGERFWEAELYRLDGELRLTPEDNPQQAEDAERCFQRALVVACQQQAKSLELRAALSLGHLWRRQGKPDDAHRLLSDVYAWFTQGFDTADVQAAKNFLDERGVLLSQG